MCDVVRRTWEVVSENMKGKGRTMKRRRILIALALLALPLAANASVTHTQGNVLALYLDEGSGADVYDSSGNHGTVSGAVHGATWTTGILGNALSFDGVGDYVEIPNSAVQSGMSQLTLEAWVYPTEINPNVAEMEIINKWGPSGISDDSYLMSIRYGKPQFVLTNGSLDPWGTLYAMADDPIALNEWTHLVGTYDGYVARIYMNGVLAGISDEIPGIVVPDGGMPVKIGLGATGSSGGDGAFIGIIDEVGIYNYAAAPIPAPAALLLSIVGVGLTGLSRLRRRR